jgi:SAM-dependent methyltransferase
MISVRPHSDTRVPTVPLRPANRVDKLASSFGSVAEDYDLGRPAYPRDSVTWAFGRKPLTMLDIGAGTGKLTRVLAEVGHRVTAVEPLPTMTAVLETRLFNVATVTARAERLPFDSESFCALAVGQAFHWFDYDTALTEMARVTRPGAMLALFWNVYAGDADWVEYPRRVPVKPLNALKHHWAWRDLEHYSEPWQYPVTTDSLLAFARSHSSVAALSNRKRRAYTAKVIGQVSVTADAGPLPLVTHVWRCRRVGDRYDRGGVAAHSVSKRFWK